MSRRALENAGKPFRINPLRSLNLCGASFIRTSLGENRHINAIDPSPV